MSYTGLEWRVMSVASPPLYHVGIAVAGVKAAAADFERRWGAPMYRVNAATFPAARFRGQPVELSAGYEFFNTGASEIEVVSTPSPDTGFPGGNGGDGVHRLACIVDATG